MPETIKFNDLMKSIHYFIWCLPTDINQFIQTFLIPWNKPQIRVYRFSICIWNQICLWPTGDWTGWLNWFLIDMMRRMTKLMIMMRFDVGREDIRCVQNCSSNIFVIYIVTYWQSVHILCFISDFHPNILYIFIYDEHK